MMLAIAFLTMTICSLLAILSFCIASYGVVRDNEIISNFYYRMFHIRKMVDVYIIHGIFLCLSIILSFAWPGVLILVCFAGFVLFIRYLVFKLLDKILKKEA